MVEVECKHCSQKYLYAKFWASQVSFDNFVFEDGNNECAKQAGTDKPGGKHEPTPQSLVRAKEQMANQAAGHGAVTNVERDAQKKANEKDGRGSFSDQEIATQKATNSAAGYHGGHGWITDVERDARPFGERGHLWVRFHARWLERQQV